MKLIISGVPCCRKTDFGNWLRDTHGFEHFDLESPNTSGHPAMADLQVVLEGFRTGRSKSGDTAISRMSALPKDVVVTWGYPRNDHCFGCINAFRQAGFSAWWFDGDLDLARTKYVQRDAEEAAKR